jgi:putative phosphoribosyl transferase
MAPRERSRGFRDRASAGRALGERLCAERLTAPVVVALPRGGVPVAFEVALALDAPLDIALVRKLGAPGQPELGIGALAGDGTLILDRDAVHELGVTSARIEATVRRETAELERQRRLYRGEREPVDVAGRTVVLVDDGLATGGTAIAAVAMLRNRGAARTIVAVPVCPAAIGARLGDRIGELVCLQAPLRFGGVGAWYDDFSQTSDSEVLELLRRAEAEPGD